MSVATVSANASAIEVLSWATAAVLIMVGATVATVS